MTFTTCYNISIGSKPILFYLFDLEKLVYKEICLAGVPYFGNYFKYPLLRHRQELISYIKNGYYVVQSPIYWVLKLRIYQLSIRASLSTPFFICILLDTEKVKQHQSLHCCIFQYCNFCKTEGGKRYVIVRLMLDERFYKME